VDLGCGAFGRLGHNDEQDRLLPMLLVAEVFEGSKIVTVAAAGFHTMAVGGSGALWTYFLGILRPAGPGRRSARSCAPSSGNRPVLLRRMCVLERVLRPASRPGIAMDRCVCLRLWACAVCAHNRR
jgi:hypothetical protein